MPSFFIRPDSPSPSPRHRHLLRPRLTVIPRKLNFDTSPSPPPTTTTTTTTNTPTTTTVSVSSPLDSLIQMCELKVQKLRLQWEEDEKAARLAYKRRVLMSMRKDEKYKRSSISCFSFK